MAAAVLLGTSTAAAAIIDTVDVGTGLYSSLVQIDFANGNGYAFNVHWQDASTTGWDLLLTIAADLDTVELDYSTSEFGVFLQGIEVMGDVDWGVGAGWPEIEDYWHYWTAEPGEDDWTFAMVGADLRTVSDGSLDGWVFLSPDAPQPLPAPGSLLLLAMAGACRRRRRGRSRRESLSHMAGSGYPVG